MEIKNRNHSGSARSNVFRIFFASCDSDYSRTYRKIANDILLFVDCDIYSDRALKSLNHELMFVLEQMHLIVIPITKTLVNNENTIVSELIPFVRSTGIPLLPILMDAGIEEKFNRLVGHMQLLDAISDDPTTREYYHKLYSYLDTIALKDEDHAHIIGEFEAQLFLSYRKQDREAANKLMKQIHAIPQFHDVAIWYDELLTPGENYDDNIERAILKSNAVILLLTKQTLEKDNYILKNEYPYAVKNNIPILGVKVPPDLDVNYQAQFPHAAIVDSDSELILAHLKKLLMKQKRELRQINGAEHFYYIGLAYQYGVMAEIDHKRSIALITESAILGFQPAIRFLKELYWADTILTSWLMITMKKY